jgi:malate dehydrogenase (oxaloacetate-decarboxylating)
MSDYSGGIFSVETNLRRLDSRLLSIIYTPGVAEPCRRIADNSKKSFQYGGRSKTAFLLSNAGFRPDKNCTDLYPLLEIRAILYRQLSGVDVYPCLADVSDVELPELANRLQSGAGTIILENLSDGFPSSLLEKMRQQLEIPLLQGDVSGRVLAVLALLCNIARRRDCHISDLSLAVGAPGRETGLLQKILVETELTENVFSKNAPRNVDVVVVFNSGEQQTRRLLFAAGPETVFVAGGWSKIPADKGFQQKNIITGGYDGLNCLSGLLVAPALLAATIHSQQKNLSAEKMVAVARGLAALVEDQQLQAGRLLPDPLSPSTTLGVAKILADEFEIKDKKDFLTRLRQNIYERDPDYYSRHIWENFENKELSDLGADYYRTRRGPVNCSPRPRIADKDSFRKFYRPGCLYVINKIAENRANAFQLTGRSNLVAVATNGTAVLGLGDIGPRAARPVMEGKSALFKAFAGVNAIPLCIDDSGDCELFIETMKDLEGSLGGINLEDISAPACFEIEKRLKNDLDIPVFHDDQHGTAIVILAGLKSAAFLTGLELSGARVVINGAGAAGIAVAKILRSIGIREIILADSKGIIHEGRKELNNVKKEAAAWSNPNNLKGGLNKALKGADVFIGLSVGGLLDESDIALMNDEAIVFALANPTPEIYPEQAYRGGAAVVATGRSDFPNQVNNVMAFPGVFRGALDVRASDITENMKQAAATALFSIARENKIDSESILPPAVDFSIAPRVAEAVAAAALQEGVARRRQIDPEQIRRNTARFIREGRLE